MKAQFEKVPLTDTTFLIKREYLSYCEIPWHFHPEFELTLISKASGKKYIGNRVKDLDQDDLMLLGPYLPHRWHYDKNNNENSKRESHQIVIQFSYDFLGEGFFEKPPFSNILQLLKRANNGISFHGEAKALAKKTMNLMLKKNGFEQILELLTLLNTLSSSQHYEILSSIGFTENLNESDGNRMNQVYRFIISNFKGPITLSDVAKLSNMTPQAFCKYGFFSFHKGTATVIFQSLPFAQNRLPLHLIVFQLFVGPTNKLLNRARRNLKLFFCN